MNAFILYLEDDEKTGMVKFCAEAIGEPDQSYELGEQIVASLLKHKGAVFHKRSVFIQDPPTQRPQ